MAFDFIAAAFGCLYFVDLF